MNQSTFKILVPIDFSTQSLVGLRQAKYIVNGRNAKILALHVIRGNIPPWNMFSDDEKRLFVDKVHDKLRMLAASEQIDSNQFETYVEFGKLCDTILGFSSTIQADCIVMGTSATNNIKKRIIGSNALRVVSEANIPVITVKIDCETDDFSKLILPLDLSKETREKVPLSIHMARLLGSEIKAVSFVSTTDERIISNLQKQMTQVVDFITERNVKCSGEIISYSGISRVQKMLEYSDAVKGMALITTHQTPEIIGFLLGSFAADTIHSLNFPVMSIIPTGVIKYSSEMPGIK